MNRTVRPILYILSPGQIEVLCDDRSSFTDSIIRVAQQHSGKLVGRKGREMSCRIASSSDVPDNAAHPQTESSR